MQGFIDSGLLVAGADGVPQMNVDAVLASERQSELSETAVPEQITSITDRRKARDFGNIGQPPIDMDAAEDIDLE